LLGFAYVAPWRQKAAYRRTVEDSIYLRPAATGKRAGTKLLEKLIAESKAAGVKEIVAVISDKGAEASIALHERFGFKHQGHLGKVGFKFGRWLGTVLMQKSL
jgi:phosphinothricin acetyltransferase